MKDSSAFLFVRVKFFRFITDFLTLCDFLVLVCLIHNCTHDLHSMLVKYTCTIWKSTLKRPFGSLEAGPIFSNWSSKFRLMDGRTTEHKCTLCTYGNALKRQIIITVLIKILRLGIRIKVVRVYAHIHTFICIRTLTHWVNEAALLIIYFLKFWSDSLSFVKNIYKLLNFSYF